ncbi:glycoside hydrolase family 43 protein [Nonomuraea sp. B19D2]|uniref:glycoside hydrolase family 43 protein n=1 Tax=Nonomuraea sp. B19D2 TaxID=3159561 RepID=UPI0032DA702F
MPEYRNPIIGGFHPDPSICRVGEDYYLACSSFEYFPGVPIFHSRDLVHWRQIGNILDRPEQLDLPPSVRASGGIWAPTLRHHDGLFWMITKNVTGRGNFLVTAERAEGPWSDPVWIDLPGIDPDLAWDSDGTCYCTFSGLQQARIDPKRGVIVEGPWPVWSGTGLAWPEGPHLYRRGDWWYLLMSEGGTHTGHAISVARARSPRGPFTPAPANPILSHRSTNRPIQAIGHADLVDTPEGDWWMVLLGIRPKGRFPYHHVLGRETFLAPVTWVDDWPVVGPIEEHGQAPRAWNPLPAEPERDDFDATALSPRWISPRSRPPHAWSLTERPGWLTLRATGDTLDRPGTTFLGRRQQHHDVRVAARLDPGTGCGGLSVRLDEAHHYDLEVGGGQARVIARIGPVSHCVAYRTVPPGPLDLIIDFRTTDVLPPTVTGRDQLTGDPLGVVATGPDTVTMTIDAAQPDVLAELDGRYLSTEVATGFTGRVIGMYATGGSVSFDWYDYRPPGDA